eukprot:492337_1
MVHTPQQQQPEEMDSTREFTMVFIDLDDTLIPTTIRNSLRLNFGFDLFRVMQMDTDTLQLDIINSINKIKNSIDTHSDVQFALVTDASTKWMQEMVTSKHSKFPILGRYLKVHDIACISALEATTKYLRDKYGVTKANDTISTKYNDHRFMFKYMTFSMLIHKYAHKLNAKCTRVISIGDGEHEHQSMRLLSQRHKDIHSISVRLRKAPTLNQLQSEWKYIDDCVDGVLGTAFSNKCDPNKSNFIEIDVDHKFKGDNNALCTGKYQLDAIALYFNMFMKMTKKTTLEAVCRVVYINLNTHKPSPRDDQFKAMLKIAVKNEEFSKSMSKMVKSKSMSQMIGAK